MGSNALSEAYQYLYESYKLNNKLDSVYKYQGYALLYKDSDYTKTIKNLTDFQKLSFKEKMRLQELEDENALTAARTRTYALLSGLVVFLLIALLLYRNNRQKRKAKGLSCQHCPGFLRHLF